MKRVFLSFVAEDRQVINGLRLLAANPNYALEFYDESVRAPYDSQDAAYIKRKISEKIARASVTVCFVSQLTHQSKWVDWELRESHRSGNRILIMALKGVESAILPAFAKEMNLSFYAWSPERLQQLIEDE